MPDFLNSRLWPFGPRKMVLGVPVILISLLILVGVLRSVAGFPSKEADNFTLVGILALSLLPVLLATVDLFTERGAVLEFSGAKLDFSRLQASGPPAVPVATNIGVPSQPVTDSDTNQILKALRKAVSAAVVIIDLEDGRAWWETRLLTLVAGAVRLGQPHAMVFVGADGGEGGIFQGWATPQTLLRALLANPSYAQCYFTAQSVASQWALLTPIGPGQTPLPLTWMQGPAQNASWMAFDGVTGLPNEFAAEQVLAAKLGKIESNNQTEISLIRLQELFKPVLHVTSIDEAATREQQLKAFFSSSGAYVPVTLRGQYQRLLRRCSVSNTLLESLLLKENEK